MDINLSQFAGFCDGVKRAYDMIMDLDITALKQPVFALGSLVHNDDVASKIEELGIRTISRDDFFASKSGDIGTIIITAHGTGPDIFKEASEKQIDVIDTTCPRVTKVQRLASLYVKRGYRIIIVGDKDHKEVRGINDWGDGKAFVISSKDDILKIPFSRDEKIAFLAQTTQNEEFFHEVFAESAKSLKNAELVETTCHATHDRQKEVKELAKHNEAMIIIGSQKSANSKRLWEISVAINPRSYFIENASELEDDWIKGTRSVGVTAGASTPDWIIEEVLEKVKKLDS